jgi:hypothetical protein
MKWDRIEFNEDVVDSLRFYMMLSIKMNSLNQYSPFECNKTLKEFIKDGEDWHVNNKETINAYIKKAYLSLPLDFQQIYNLTIPWR